jgi:hypothetical protein
MRFLDSSRRARFLLGCAGLALTLVGFAIPAVADWPPPGTDLPVCTTGRDQDRLTVCSDGAGGMYVGWYDRRESYYQEIRAYVQHVLSSGVNDPAWPADGVLVHNGGTYDTGSYWWTGAYPLLIADGSGGAVCVTYVNSRPNDCYYNSLHASRVTSSGAVVNKVELCPFGTDCYGGMEGFSAIPDGAGGVKIIYSYGDRTNNISYIHYRADGTSTPILTVCDAPYRQYRPKITSDAAGGAIVAWVDDRSQDGGWNYGASDLFAHHILPDDTIDPNWTPNGVTICAGSGQVLDSFALTYDGSGGAYIVWRGCGDYLAAQRILATGALAWGEVPFAYGNAGGDPVIATDDNGGAYVAYTEAGYVFAHHLISSGDDPTWSGAGEELGQGYSSPMLMPDGSGGAYLWPRYGPQRYQHVDLSGRDSGWPYEGIALSSSTTSANLLLVDGGAGAIRAAWVDTRNGNQDIYAQGATYIPPDPTSVAPEAPATCVSTVTPCVTVPVDITRSDATPVRGCSIDVELSPNLMLCNGLASITEGTYLSGIGTTQFQILDNGGGSYTVDCVIMGQPCGATAPAGTLFNLAVKTAGSDGTGTVTVTSVLLRDCANAPIACDIGPAASMTIDMTAPAAITDLSGEAQVSGHDADGTLGVTLTFSPPGDAEIVEVYRAPYGTGDGTSAYPEYDDVPGAGSPPAPSYPPGDPWTLTDVIATGGVDEVTTRGFWSYAVFTKDACGNVSAVSNVTAGTLNYLLGDYTPPLGGGNNVVGGLDVSALGAHYGASLVFNDTYNYLDIGPTTDGSPQAMPETDDHLNFEDLMILGINYDDPGGFQRQGPVVTGPASLVGIDPMQPPVLSLRLDPVLRPGDPLVAHLRLGNNAGQVKGIHALISFDATAYELIGTDAGDLTSDGEVFWTTLADPRGIWVDAVSLGEGRTFTGSGEVARLRFRQRGQGAAPALAVVDLRDAGNRAPGVANERDETGADRVVTAGLAVVGGLELGPIAHPNPFSGRTDISFRISAASPVDMRIYDVAGRLVRAFSIASLSAGDHMLTWDGRLENGALAGRGVYFYELRTGAQTWRRKLLMID